MAGVKDCDVQNTTMSDLNPTTTTQMPHVNAVVIGGAQSTGYTLPHDLNSTSISKAAGKNTENTDEDQEGETAIIYLIAMVIYHNNRE